jgi:two-component system OmpR family sensor kinase
MKSLHRGLTLWLWVTVGVVGAVCVVIGTLQAHRETQAQLDFQMQQVAHMLAGQTFAATAGSTDLTNPQMLPSIHIHHDRDDELVVTVRGASGQLLYASRSNRQIPGGVLPSLDSLGFQTVDLGNGEYRVFSARSRDLHIEVAQSMDVIREAEAGVAMATLLPIAYSQFWPWSSGLQSADSSSRWTERPPPSRIVHHSHSICCPRRGCPPRCDHWSMRSTVCCID